jgi:hypothetical protein
MAFDRHLPACGKVDQSEAIFICTLMQAVLAYRWLMYGFPANFCFRVSQHQLYVKTLAGCVCPLQLFIRLIVGLASSELFVGACMLMRELRVVEKSAFYSNYAETLVESF